MPRSCFSPPMTGCLVISLSFTFVYTAFLALQNLQSSLNRDQNLGVTSLAVLFGCVLVFSPLSPSLIRAIGAKRVVVMAWLSFIIYIASNFYPIWATLIPASGLLGVVLGPLWTSEGLYIAIYGEKYVRLKGLSLENDLHSVLSKFGGIFFMCFYMAEISGNLVSSLVLGTGRTEWNSQALDFDLCGANDCPWTDYSNGSSNTTEGFIQPERHVVYILLGTLLGINVCGLLLTVFALPSLEPAPTSMTLTTCGHSLSCFRMAINPDMIPIVPLFVAEANFMAMLAADFTKAFVSCPLGVQWVGFVMTTYGLLCAIASFSVNHFAKYLSFKCVPTVTAFVSCPMGVQWVGFVMTTYGLLCAIASFSVNHFAKHLGRVVMIVSAIVLAVGSLTVMLAWQPSTKDSLPTFFLIPLMAGLSQGTINPQMNAIIAQLFEKEKTEAYTTYHSSKAFSLTTSFVLSLFVCLRVRLVLALCLYALGFAGYVWTELKLRRRSSFSSNRYTQKDVITMDDHNSLQQVQI